MRVLWSIHLYPPGHNCGSEWMAHNINQFLVARGHQVRVILHQASMHKIRVPYEIDGVEVLPPMQHADAYRWADVVMTHLDFTQYTIIMAREARRPLVHFIHNDIEYASITNGQSSNYVVYNSDWIAKKLNYKWESMTLHPPCDYDTYNTGQNTADNEYITLISLNENKGAKMFYEIAEAMPDKKFLGVEGSYDQQVVKQLPNVVIVPNTPDIMNVYRKTRVLLMPSKYESWGRTATEAMCSGIPVIATVTPGLKENLADAGIYVGSLLEKSNPGEPAVDIGTVDQWVKKIRSLDNRGYYRKISNRCRQRAKELDPKKELNKLEQFLIDAKFDFRNN